jgi:hypothetical protein
MWAVREQASEILFKSSALELDTLKFYGFAFVEAGTVYLLSVFFPNIYFILALVGSTACVTFCYVFPGAFSFLLSSVVCVNPGAHRSSPSLPTAMAQGCWC